MKNLHTYQVSHLQKMIATSSSKETDLKLILQELQNWEALAITDTTFHQLLDLSKMTIAYLSPSIERMTGYKHNTWMAEGLQFNFNVLHPDDRNVLRKVHELERQWFGELPFRLQQVCEFTNSFRIIHASGHAIKLLVTKHYLQFDEQGQPRLVLQICKDITPFKENNTIVLEMRGTDESTHKKIHKKFVFHPPSEAVSLSGRELEVLHCIQRGLTNKQISEQLFISLNTVKSHRKKMLAKSKCHKMTELVALVQKENLLPVYKKHNNN